MAPSKKSKKYSNRLNYTWTIGITGNVWDFWFQGLKMLKIKTAMSLTDLNSVESKMKSDSSQTKQGLWSFIHDIGLIETIGSDTINQHSKIMLSEVGKELIDIIVPDNSEIFKEDRMDIFLNKLHNLFYDNRIQYRLLIKFLILNQIEKIKVEQLKSNLFDFCQQTTGTLFYDKNSYQNTIYSAEKFGVLKKEKIDGIDYYIIKDVKSNLNVDMFMELIVEYLKKKQNFTSFTYDLINYLVSLKDKYNLKIEKNAETEEIFELIFEKLKRVIMEDRRNLIDWIAGNSSIMIPSKFALIKYNGAT